MVTLEQMMGGDPGAFFERQGAWKTQQAKQQADLESLMQQTDQRRQTLPLDLAQRQANIDIDKARLPGVQADSSIRQRDNKKQELTFDDDMRAYLGKMKSEEMKRYAEQLTQAANAYTMGGQYLEDAPGMANHEMAKQILGPLYRPEFDKIPATALGQAIRYMGQNMSQLAPKFQQEMELLNAKNQFALNKQLQAQEAAQRLAEYKGNVQKAVASMQGNKDPKTFEALGVQLRQEQYKAIAAGDNERAAFLQEEIDKVVGLIDSLKKAGAAARREGTVDTGAVSGLPTVPPAAPATLPAPAGSPPPNQTPRATGGQVGTETKNETAIFERAFGKYEPDKYDYRISPEGKPQRRLKGQ